MNFAYYIINETIEFSTSTTMNDRITLPTINTYTGIIFLFTTNTTFTLLFIYITTANMLIRSANPRIFFTYTYMISR